MKNRMRARTGPFYWALITCNIVIPQSLWSRRVRGNAFGRCGCGDGR